ncbi:MAG: transporter substrate-binding domain-containing protein [Desulfobacterales bacterium]|nr:transporter substrate-binding domain-containing protein [Desulfobacterales bacterium]
MKKRFCLVFTVAIMLNTGVFAQQSQTLELISEPWKPWITKDENGQPSGIFIKISKKIFDKAGIEYRIKYFPWKRCLHRMEKGKSDVLLMLAKSPEREKFMTFTEPVMTDLLLLYYNISKVIEWNKFEDLKTYKIGLTSGYDYGDEFNKAKERYKYRLDFAYTEKQTIMKLSAKRFDLGLMNKSVTESFLKKNPKVDNIRAAKKPVRESVYHIAFSKKSELAPLLPKINSIIEEMKSDGVIDQILIEDR